MNSPEIPVFSNDLIRASAGTGKTFALSNRYLQLLASGVSCESILATTFTRKGAGEILDRIIQRLSNAAMNPEAAVELGAEIEFELDSVRAQKILMDLLANLHRLQIGTLDSFFNRIAQSFSLELNLPEGWSIVQEQQMDLLRDSAIQDVLRSQSVLQLVRLMNKGEAQRRVAELIRQTVKSIYNVYKDSEPNAWKKVPPCETFLKREKIESIVSELQAIELDEYPDKRQKKQFDKEVHYILEENWDELINTKLFLLMFEQDPTYYRKPLPPRFVELYSQLVPHCRAHVVSRLIQQNEATYELLEQYALKFELEKTKAGDIRFEDITNRLVSYMSGLQADELAFRMDHRINHLLLDEFQDTSPSQWAVVKPFALQATQAGNGNSFFCVGDAKQAIYGWRGGVAEIFELVSRELSNVSDGKKLTTSYRSSPAVTDFVNQVFEGLEGLDSEKPFFNKAVRDWLARFEHHETARKELSGYVTMERAPEGQRGSKSPTKTSERNAEVLSRTVELVSELARKHQNDASLTIGILVRKNVTIRDLIFRLQQAGIAASEEGGNPLTDSAVVELILSAMKLADHPSDSIARFHLSHSPLASYFDLQPETPENQAVNVESAILSSTKVRADILGKGYGPTIETMAEGLVEQCTERELMRLQQLVQEAFNYDQQVRAERSRLRADQFVSYIRNEFRAHDQSSAKIRVMTVHQAKGLEFDIVVLPFQRSSSGWLTQRPEVVVARDRPTDGVSVACRWVSEQERLFLPTSFQTMHDMDRERVVRESLSVLYVALTRAVHAIHIVISQGAKATDVSDEGVLLSVLQAQSTKTSSSEGLIYEHGDPQWRMEIEESNVKPDANPLAPFYLESDSTLGSVELKTGVSSGRGRRQVSPSSLEGGSEVRLGSVFANRDNQSGLLRGSLIHCCLEQVLWLEDFQLDKEVLRQQLRLLDPLEDLVEVCIEEFEQILLVDSVVSLLSRGAYQQKFLPELAMASGFQTEELSVEVQTERAFAVLVDGDLIRGCIDRLVLVYSGETLVAADLIDFKTDQITTTNLDSRVEYYRPQLHAYRMAVSQFCHLPIENVTARLLFVASGRSFKVLLDGDFEDLPKETKQLFGGRTDVTPKGGPRKPTAPLAGPESGRSKGSGKDSAGAERPTSPRKVSETKTTNKGQQLNFWDED